MISLLSCISCNHTPDTNTFPLCRLCYISLLSAPKLCPHCGKSACRASICEFPWIQPHPRWIDSFFAFHFLTQRGLQVLRSWKKKGGLRFDRIVLNQDKISSLKTHLNQYPRVDFITPIPHSLERVWQLRHHPNHKFAKFLSTHLHIPHLPTLTTHKKKSQAKLTLVERFQNQIHHQLICHQSEIQDKNIVLIDDFKTSGQTLLSAARYLKQRGANQIHAVTLGIPSSKSNVKHEWIKTKKH